MTASIFDDVLAETSGKHEGTETEATEAQTTVAGAETTETNPSDAKTVVNLSVGQTPEGAVPVSEFAKIVNEKLVSEKVQELLSEGKTVVEAAVEAMNAQVTQASFYQAVKAQRNPLPHIEARYEVPVLDDNGQDTGETKTDTKVFIPVEAGLEYWQNRPTRGGATAATSEEDLEKRLYKAGKKAAALDAAQKRHAKLTENITRMQTQLDGYITRLAADGKTLDDAKAAYEAAAESEEESNAIGDNE